VYKSAAAAAAAAATAAAAAARCGRDTLSPKREAHTCTVAATEAHRASPSQLP